VGSPEMWINTNTVDVAANTVRIRIKIRRNRDRNMVAQAGDS
jgi:hypothetical protein